MKNYQIALLVFLFASPFSLAGQIKYEREYHLEKGKVPGMAKKFIDSCCPRSKVKWYGEESIRGRSVEAKLTYKGSLFSIEFDTLGRVQDVEKKIAVSDIPQSARLTISRNMDSSFSRHSIDKVQLQWVGSNRVLYQLIENSNSTMPHTTNYEIVVKGRKNKSTRMYEMLFTSDGHIVRAAEIVQRNTDNLDY